MDERRLVVFGIDRDGYERAGWFSLNDAHLASRAATALGYRAHDVPAELVPGRLPKGNVCAPGTRFIRRVRITIFRELLTAVGDSRGTSRRTRSAG
jgi:hypothetical protein